MTHVTCRLTAKNRDQLGNPIRSVFEYGLPFTFLVYCRPKTPNCVDNVCVRQINVFLSRLNGEPIGVSVLGIFVIDKNTILAVRQRTSFESRDVARNCHSISFWYRYGPVAEYCDERVCVFVCICSA